MLGGRCRIPALLRRAQTTTGFVLGRLRAYPARRLPAASPDRRLDLGSRRAGILQRPRRRILTVLLAAVLAAGAGAPAHAADPGASRRRLAALAQRIQDAEAREGVLADRVARLDRTTRATETQLAGLRHALAARTRAAYVSGLGGDVLTAMLTSDDPSQVVDRLALLTAASRRDDVLIRHATALRRRLAEQRRTADAARREVAALQARLRADAVRLTGLLARAAAASRTPARAPRASRTRLGSGTYACLVGPNHAFTDTYGQPRPGGRRHKGVDVFAPWGSPSYAVTAGVVRRLSSSANGGLQLYLAGNDGNEYFYAHMSSYTSHAGQRVVAGEEIARVGSTGDARYTSPHVHFEVHPGGGAPVNPYPYAKRFCG